CPTSQVPLCSRGGCVENVLQHIFWTQCTAVCRVFIVHSPLTLPLANTSPPDILTPSSALSHVRRKGKHPCGVRGAARLAAWRERLRSWKQERGTPVDARVIKPRESVQGRAVPRSHHALCGRGAPHTSCPLRPRLPLSSDIQTTGTRG